jgi:hypothetical protein
MREYIAGVDWGKLKAELQAILLKIILSDSAGAELSEHIRKLDIELSTRASESTLSAIRAQTDKLTFDVDNRLAIQNPPNLDVALSTRASESTLSAIRLKTDNLDVPLSTRASEETLLAIKTQTDKLTFDANNRLAIQNPPNLDVLLSTRASESTLLALLNSFKSSLKASLFNQSVTANTNIFASYLTPASPPCTFRFSLASTLLEF